MSLLRRCFRTHFALMATLAVPAAILTVLAEFPVTDNGKLDRKELKRIMENRPAAIIASVESSIEQTVQKIWETIMGRSGFGIHADFFDVGGTSLALIRILQRISERYGVSISASELVEEATVAHMARCIELQLSTTASSATGIAAGHAQ